MTDTKRPDIDAVKAALASGDYFAYRYALHNIAPSLIAYIEALEARLAASEGREKGLRGLLTRTTELLDTYHKNVPLGHHPHMIALVASDTIIEARAALAGDAA